MIFKITERDINVVKNALQEALNHTHYNSECFSCSDIRVASSFVNDIERVFNILKDNKINILKDSDEEFRNKFKGYYVEKEFEKIVTPEKFEFLLYSDAIWRTSEDLLNLKCSTDKFLTVKKQHFNKYWSAATNGCAYEINPTKEALLEFSNLNSTLKKSLDFILPEIENSDINEIKALIFKGDEIELKILYTKESKNYSLYLYEDKERADLTLSSDKVALKIYPIYKESKSFRILYDKNLVDCFRQLDLEYNKLNAIADTSLQEKLNIIDQNPTKFRNIDSSTLDGEIYSFWKHSKDYDLKKEELESMDDKNSRYDYLTYEIEDLSYKCETLYYQIKEKLIELLASDNFIASYRETCKQLSYMLDEDCLVENNSYVNHVFDFIQKEIKSNVA